MERLTPLGEFGRLEPRGDLIRFTTGEFGSWEWEFGVQSAECSS